MAAVSVNEFEKALQSLQEALHAYADQQNLALKKMLRDAVIQRFEFSCELAWKISMKVLGLPATSPKLGVRDMAQSGLIADIQLWFDFIEARNKSSHSYDEDIAIQVLSKVTSFVPEAQRLLQVLKTK